MKIQKSELTQLLFLGCLSIVFILASCNGNGGDGKYNQCKETRDSCITDCKESLSSAQDYYLECKFECDTYRKEGLANCNEVHGGEFQDLGLANCKLEIERGYNECMGNCGNALNEANNTAIDCNYACWDDFDACVK